MAISRTIFQTFKTSKLPLITRLHIAILKRKNPQYDYQFYDDARIDHFIQSEFDPETYALYKRIAIGAAKADFFRYAVLYKKGGVYLDIDSSIKSKLDDFISPNDSAVVALERNTNCYVQYALFFEAGHPFLKKTLEVIIKNLKENKYPYDVHKTTGPSAFTEAIKACLSEFPAIKYTQLGADYDQKVQFSYPMSKFFLYGLSRKNHWKKQIKSNKILKD